MHFHFLGEYSKPDRVKMIGVEKLMPFDELLRYIFKNW